MTAWGVPRIWPGEVVIVLASGPSLTVDQVDAARASGHRSIVVNATFELMPDADWLHAPDARFWRAYPLARKFEGTKTTCEPAAAGGGVRLLEVGRGRGFDPDPSRVGDGGNGGHMSICIAAHAGAARVVLLGFDCRPVGRRLHWHGRHPAPCVNPTADTFAEWRSRMRVLARDLRARGGPEVINATPGSAVDAFGPVVSLDAALA